MTVIATRAVLDPYTNAYFTSGNAYPVQVDATLAPGFSLTEFPNDVPAYYATHRPLPANDLGWTAKPTTGDPTYNGVPLRDPTTGPFDDLGDERQALATAEAFLRDQGLVATDLLPGTVESGGSITTSGGGQAAGRYVTDWLVTFPQHSPDGVAVQGMGITVRVAPGRQVAGVSWRLYDFREDGVIRLRPLTSAMADPTAWSRAATSRGLGVPARDPAVSVEPVRLQVSNAQLQWTFVPGVAEDDDIGHYIVPLYALDVTLAGVTPPAAASGQWDLIAASDVRRQ